MANVGEKVPEKKPEISHSTNDLYFPELTLWKGPNPPEEVGSDLEAAILEGLRSAKSDPVLDGETVFKDLKLFLKSLSNAKASSA